MKANSLSLLIGRFLTFASLAFTGVTYAAPGNLDTTFVPGDGNLEPSVRGTAVQPDGKVVVGGEFSDAGADPAIDNLARLEAGGALDTTFQPGNGTVLMLSSVVVLPDGKILAGGLFNDAGGDPDIDYVARFHPDGTLDTTFKPGNVTINNPIRSMALQPDGKIVIAGVFTDAGGDPDIDRVARLNPDGTLDTTFKPGDDALNDKVNAVAIQSDGKVLVGGEFLNAGGDAAIDRLARLNADGTVDTSYETGDGAFISPIFAIAIQPDGKAFATGDSTGVGGNTNISRVVRLNTNGTVDTTFVPGANTVNNTILSAALQADGKIIVCGPFSNAGGNAGIDEVARFHSDGTLDTTFVPGDATFPFAALDGLSLQADGKVIVSGDFSNIVGNAGIDGVARLENDPATGSLKVPTLGHVKWLRGGAAPEATRVTFESTTNGGSSWKFLGAGTRIAGGWQITGASFPAMATVRARAYTTGGVFNGSSGIVEAFATAPPAAIPDTWSTWYGYANTYYNYYAALGFYDYAFAFYYYYVGIGDYYFYSAYGNAPLASYQYYVGLAYYFYHAYSSFGGGTASYHFYLHFAYAYYSYYLGVGDSNSASYFFNYYYSVALAFL